MSKEKEIGTNTETAAGQSEREWQELFIKQRKDYIAVYRDEYLKDPEKYITDILLCILNDSKNRTEQILAAELLRELSQK